MGVADKQTYKNQYHFTDDKKDTSKEHPSIAQDPKINSTIKENPYRSNVEIEGDEIVLQPDMSALFKALGKKHNKGGMDVLLKPNSFVFSDFKDLTISPKEHELFELKEGGTPAKTLKKNVNPKHYNTMVEILDNPFKDDLSKNSASKMLEKYIATLGNIAYLQEKKKGFPTGLPEFAMGTAPVYDEDLETEIDSNKQYMKAGGIVSRMAFGGEADAECPCGRFPNGMCKPCPTGEEGKWNPYINSATVNANVPAGYNSVYKNNQGTLYQGYTPGGAAVPRAVPGGVPGNPWKNKIQSLINSGASLDELVQAGHGTKSGLSSMFDWSKASQGKDDFVWSPNQPDGGNANSGFKCPDGQYWNSIYGKCMPLSTAKTTIETGKVTGDPQGSKVANWEFTPWQKLSQMYNWGQYANVKRYMPYRSRFNATYVDPALVNPEQAIGDAKGLGNQQIQALNTLNPILRNAQAQANFGNVLGAIPGLRTQYDNQNQAIINQSRQYNNQVKNNESMVNMGNDQQYYQQAIAGRTNYDNMKSFLSNQAMSGTLKDVETNQKLAYNLLTQNNPAYNFNWKTGYFDRTNKSILDAQSSQTSGIYDEIIKGIQSLPDSDPRKWDIYERLLRQKNILPYLQQQASPFTAKKGGKIKRNPYK